MFTMRPLDFSCGVGYGWTIMSFHHETTRLFSWWVGGLIFVCLLADYLILHMGGWDEKKFMEQLL